MKNNLVVQANALIEAHYKHEYSVQEQRTILWVISEVHKASYFFKDRYGIATLRISAQKYAELMGVSVQNIYRDAQKIGRRLMEKVLKIETAQGWEMFHWVSSMTYIKKEAMIEISLSQNILPYITELQQYTSFKLENILYLCSSHAIKIYQLLAQYKSIGYREIKVNTLRSTLGIENLDAYKLYGNIKSRILEISKREINEKTDLNISYTEIKNGRKVESIKFKITSKQTKEHKFLSNEPQYQNTSVEKIKPILLEKAKMLIMNAKTGWDLYAIEQQFYSYIEKVGNPKNLEAAFLGFVKKKIKTFP